MVLSMSFLEIADHVAIYIGRRGSFCIHGIIPSMKILDANGLHRGSTGRGKIESTNAHFVGGQVF